MSSESISNPANDNPADDDPADDARRGAVSVVERLMEVVVQRKRTRPAESYTTQLLSGGVPRIGEKVREEADEAIEAAGEPGEAGREHLGREAADLVYHLLVLLAARDVHWRDVEAELARRFGISGLEEKDSRRP